MEQEIIKWIEGYEDLYQITSWGRVISADRYDRFNRHWGGEVKQHLTGSRRDYWFVSLYKDGKPKQFYVHQLVAKAFIPNPENKKCVDHIDNDKNNNHVENLRWVTHKENMNNTITLQRMREESEKYISQAGADNPFSRKVAVYKVNGEHVGDYDSIGQALTTLGLPKTTNVARVIKQERSHTHGFVFKYLSDAQRSIQRSNRTSYGEKPVLQVDEYGNVVAEYNSITEASKKTGFLACSIGRAANGVYKTYKGYKWRYK